ncbi:MULTISPECIES: tetratricopeptide repeat protein [unclassified Lebetimonas]|uniref:tetratricopeptide repeat protein n=1 Tax=unclassified Lebetimonas TaxID=2648158 RepID=UPI0004672D39|nr:MULTISPECIES: tetratricopeptide repeat protein [unclassified Lebetimonas]
MKKWIMLIIVSLNLFALNIKDIYYKSYNYEKMGDYKDAIKVLIPLYKKYPNGYTLNLRLGYLFFLNKNYNNSIKHYTKASLILPYSIEPLLGLARVYLYMGKYDKTIEYSELIIKKDYYNFYANYYLANALYYKKDFKSSLSVANKMLTLYPTNVLFLTQLGLIYEMLDKQKAKEIFKNVIILDPNNIIAKKYLK